MSERYERILVGVDGSRQAKRAVEKAIAVAVRNEADLIIVTIMTGGDYVGIGNNTKVGFGFVDQEVMDEARQRSEQTVDAYRKQAEEAGVKHVETSVFYGHPNIDLAKTLPQEYNADLIMIGAIGSNVVERMLMGSTASAVVTNAVTDVLIVRTDMQNHSSKFKRV
ncbi:universal stress protein [Levilactobacillus parabrevis]|uniref:Universal stress protein n=1 Tax=Levilactobacillus parabrevis ATCC 53295 TaxID=1267003 RepID=A0A0R1GQH6_9LACO|nr:universal stress protein [Levilactobacillus parabrevis]KRK36310.1 UspA family nucleotide-binding protein [Levilactobacillus parabrevis ATCC 53295]KRO05684.1 UspA family nucleotide-binding protein [Levilactobacillus parabrevis]MCT4486577.1 universal stress protein [Levilactobacillus parabrevis]MCT4489792.1 universal stress protein [Levilactobacillus parabrevis]